MSVSDENYSHNNMQKLLERADRLKWFLIPIFCVSFVISIILVSVLMTLSGGYYPSSLLPAISILRISLISNAAMLIALSLVLYFFAGTKSKYETGLLIHQHDLENIITDRTKSLEIKTKELESIFMALPDSFFQLNTECRIVKLFSGDKIRQNGGTTAIGKDIREYLPLETGEQIEQAIAETLKTGSLQTIECDIVFQEEPLGLEFRIIASADEVITCAVRDITKRREYEKSLEKTLAEREIMLGEIHHRVKNNLMIIISLINFCEDSTEESDTSHLHDLQNRIYSLSLIYEQLFHSDLLSQIKLNNYLGDLTSSLLASFSRQNVQFSLNIPDILLTPEKIVPLGLITTELLTTALRFRPEEQAEKLINIKLDQIETDFVMTINCRNLGYSDNAQGIMSGSLGGRLIDILIEQLNGTISFKNTEGAEAVIKFPA